MGFLAPSEALFSAECAERFSPNFGLTAFQDPENPHQLRDNLLVYLHVFRSLQRFAESVNQRWIKATGIWSLCIGAA
jgi:hypothetical protein